MNKIIEALSALNRRLSHEDGLEGAQKLAQKTARDLNLLDREIEAMNEETKEAILALTNTRVPIWEVFPKYSIWKFEFGKETYFSGDFRDHPDFEKHFATLEKYWGKLPPENSKRRTLEILKILREQRFAARKKLENENFDPKNYNDRVCEVVWRRVGESDIFMVGFSHTREYYSAQKKWLVPAAAQASVVAIETGSDIKNGNSLNLYWQLNGKDGSYDLLMRDVWAQNPKATFVEIDPRDDSKIFLDRDKEFNFPKLTPEFLMNYFEFLREVSPHLALDWLADPAGLENALKKLSTTKGQEILQHMFLQKGEMQYFVFPFLLPEGKNKTEFTGLELGQVTFADAMSALKLRRLAQFQAEGKLPPGPIVDFEGALHIVGKKQYFDNPAKALEVILQNPHFVRQVDLLLGERNLHDIHGYDREFSDFVKKHYSRYLQVEGKTEDFKAIIRKLFSDFMLETSTSRQKLILDAFDAGQLDKIFDWKYWEGIPADAFEIHFAKPRPDGGLDEWGLDFSGKKIEK